jgi:hypothetical protein
MSRAAKLKWLDDRRNITYDRFSHYGLFNSCGPALSNLCAKSKQFILICD